MYVDVPSAEDDSGTMTAPPQSILDESHATQALGHGIVLDWQALAAHRPG